MKIFLLTALTLGVVVFGNSCPPGFLQCPNGPCSLFVTRCLECKAGELVCPNGDVKCASSYDGCKLLPFMDLTVAEEDRVKDVVSRLTLEEKAKQMDFHTGEAPAVEKLGIPGYAWGNEALHGLLQKDVTVFPNPVNLGATWDTNLYHLVYRAVSNEARGKFNAYRANPSLKKVGINFWAPNINLARDPRWGRSCEVNSEDPVLTGTLTKTMVQAMQEGKDAKYKQTISTCKHFAAYDLENWEKYNRLSFDAIVSAWDMNDSYLRAFEDCVKGGHAGAVMCSYNSINGVPSCANPTLLTNVLGNWGFDGFVVSDYGAIDNIYSQHHYTKSLVKAVGVSVTSGCDLDGAGDDYSAKVPEAVLLRDLDESAVNRAVGNLFKARIRLGLFDPPSNISYNYISPDVVDSAEHRALARTAAQKSIVLLKNDGTLPLNPSKIHNLALIGPNAVDKTVLLGNYAGTPTHWLSIAEAFAAEQPNIQYHVEPGCKDNACTSSDGFDKAIQAVQASDAVVLVLGLDGSLENEGHDRTTIVLPGMQQSLADKVMAAAEGKPVVIVLIHGGALAIPQLASSAPAILTAFYPGEEGGRGLVDVIMGSVSPAAKLPVTFYAGDDQLFDFANMTFVGRTHRYFKGKPIYPFGHGLTYSTFAVDAVQAVPSTIHPCDSFVVTTTLHNVGNITSDEVMQVYMTFDGSTSDLIPVQALVGFQRYSLVPFGQAQSVSISVNPSEMAVTNPQGERILLPGNWKVWCGTGPPDQAPGHWTDLVISGQVTPLSKCS